MAAADLEGWLREALAHANRLVPSEAGSVYLHRPRTDDLVIAVCFGPSAARVARTVLPRGRGFAGYCFDHGALFSNDVRADARFYDRVDAQAAFRTRSVLCAPLTLGERTLGVVQLLNRRGTLRRPGAYETRELEWVGVLAELISRSILHATAAVRDPLTGLLNSRALHERLEEALGEAAHDGTPVSVLFLDLDHFKRVNDRYGHLVGSRVLVETARLLRASAEAEDVLGRYGGDEFVVLLPGAGPEQARRVAERMRREVEAARPLAREGIDLGSLTCSIGCASTRDGALDAGALLQLADAAMYRAKIRRNRVAVAADAVPRRRRPSSASARR